MDNIIVVELPRSSLRIKHFFNKLSKNSQLHCDEIYLAKCNCRNGNDIIPVLRKNRLYAVVKGSPAAISKLNKKYRGIDVKRVNPFTYELLSDAYISGKSRYTENVELACNKFDKNLDTALSFSWVKANADSRSCIYIPVD